MMSIQNSDPSMVVLTMASASLMGVRMTSNSAPTTEPLATSWSSWATYWTCPTAPPKALMMSRVTMNALNSGASTPSSDWMSLYALSASAARPAKRPRPGYCLPISRTLRTIGIVFSPKMCSQSTPDAALGGDPPAGVAGGGAAGGAGVGPPAEPGAPPEPPPVSGEGAGPLGVGRSLVGG